MADDPYLIFFRSTPEATKISPSLCSSLQSLESAFLLISQHRFPHALVLCASAIESVLMFGLHKSPDCTDGLAKLMRQAAHGSSILVEFEHGRLDGFRKLRNDIVHRGYSPKDDARAVAEVLETGFPFLDACYHVYADFSLQEGLLEELSWHLGVAGQVMRQVHDIPNLDASYCLNAFGHLVNWSIRDSLAPGWEVNAAIEGVKSRWTYEQKEKLEWELESEFGASWSFGCPVCRGADSFICGLNLDVEAIKADAGFCVDCDLRIPSSWPFLTDALCRKQIDERRKTILKEYGIACD